ncbi:MAG: MFS transporter [Gammaproteobacteria bacterium]|nr:MFS transporter [Gammaproteobacteria bacterium]
MTDSQYKWIVVAYTLIIQAVSLGILVYCFALFAVPWLDEFNATRTYVMLTGSLLQFGVGVFSPFAGRAMDRFSLRSIILLGLALMGTGLVLVSQARSLWQIQLVYATIFPLAAALMGPLASQTLIANWFSGKRGFAFGLSATGTNLGGILFPLLAASWLALLGWRDTFIWLAVVSVVVVGPLTWLLLRRSPPATSAGHSADSVDGRFWSTRELLTTSMFWIPLLCILPLTLTFSAVLLNLGAYSRDLGFDGDTAAQLLALSSLSMILGKFFFGGLGDRLDHRKLYWVAALFMATAMLILLGEPSIWVLAVGVVCVGLAGGGILPLMGLIFGARFGVASFGRVMGLAMIGFTVGATGPLLAGWVYDLTGSYDSAFLLFLASILPAAIAMRWLPDAPQLTASIR